MTKPKMVTVPQDGTIDTGNGVRVPTREWMDRVEGMVRHGIRRATEMGAATVVYYVW